MISTKRIYYQLMLLCFSALCLSCSSNKVQLMEASKQVWVSGAPGGRHGVKYRAKVMIKSADVQFKTCWIGNDSLPFTVSAYRMNDAQHYKAGDSVLIEINEDSWTKVDRIDPPKAPKFIANGGLIEYSVKGKKALLEIPVFTEIAARKGN